MGVVAKVNVTPQRAKKLWKGTWSYSSGQKEQIRRIFTQYLFYEPIKKNERKCYCTACGSVFTFKKWEEDSYYDDFSRYGHKDVGHCPYCENSVTFLAIGRYKNFSSLLEIKPIVIFKKTKQGLYAMAIKAYLEYDSYHPERPELNIAYYSQYCFTGKECAQWKNEYNYATGSWDKWELQKNINEPFPSYGGMGWDFIYDGGYYVIGVDEIFKSPMKYCSLDYHIPNIENLYYSADKIMKYLGYYTHRPQMEMVAKLLPTTEILDDLVLHGKTNVKDINWKAKTPEKFLRLSKDETKEFIKSQETLSTLRKWRAEAKSSGESLKDYLYRITFFEGYGVDAQQLCRGQNIVIGELIRYMEKQKKKNEYTISTAFRLWRDYIEAASKCHYDLTEKTVLLPKNLQERHDTAISQVEYERDEAATKKYHKKLYPKLKRQYSYEKDGLSIIIPKTTAEIVSEGKDLHHCVGGYAERHCKGQTVILFLRKTEHIEDPYATIEMRGDSIVQIHGQYNEYLPGGITVASPRELHKEFFAGWLEWLIAGSQRTKQGKPVPVAHKKKEQILANAV